MRRTFLWFAVMALVAASASAEVCVSQTSGTCYPPMFGGECAPGDERVAECPATAPLDYCLNASTGACGPASIFGGTCPEDFSPVASCPVVVPTPVPTPTPEPGFLDKVKITLSQSLVLKLLGVFASMVVFIQAVKKVLEKIKDWEWLIKLIPQIGVVVNFLAHGVGPIVLNALLTLAVSAPAVLADGMVTLREIITLIGLVIGNDVFYRLIRDWLGIFPKGKDVTP